MSVVLSEHLPLLASAPDGIQKLRGLILELAVRGKLAAQDPNDEPASELLKKIAEERARLEAEGICRKSKPIRQDDEEDLPFALPPSWEWSHLGGIGVIGSSSRVHQKDWTDQGVPFYRAREIVKLSQDGFVQNELFISETLYESLAASGLVPVENDLMVTGVGTIGVPYIVKTDDRFYFKDASVLIFKNYHRLVAKYIRIFMTSPCWVRRIHEKSMGTTVHTLTIVRANEVPVPIPPLAEQHRIVAKVDELMALCDRLEAEQADAASAHARLVETLLGTLTQSTDAADLAANWQRLAEHFDTLFATEASIDALKQTVLQLAVMGKLVPQNPNDEPASKLLKRIGQERARLEAGGTCKKSKSMPPVGEDEQPFEVPESWVWERIGNYAIQTDYGLSEKTLPASEGIPVLKMGDIQAGKVVLGGQKVVPLATEGLPYLFLEPDDLLYNRTNSAELVGKTGIFRGLAQQYSFASYLIRIRCFNKLVSPTFLNFVMNAPMFRETEIVPHLKQQCGQANVNGTILRNMRIPVPPAAEQHRIVAKVDELMALCDRLKADVATARQHQATLADTLIDAALEAA